MTGHSWKLMRIFGIEIRIDPSWLIIATLISYSLFFGLKAVYPAAGTMPTVVISVLGAVLFFTSVLLHELTHAVVARRRGLAVKDITLFLFGGATEANVESKGPVNEFVVSVVGPLSSFVLALVFAAVRALVLSVADGALAGVLGYLAWANVLLGVFNFLPGLPLDGGRVLRSALWKSTGDLDRSTKVASVVGEVLGYALIAVGALVFFAGGIFQGLWFAAIGWFLSASARASYAQMRIRRSLEHVEAAEVMESDPVRIPLGTTVTDAVHDYLLRHDHDAFAIEDHGHIVGVVTLESVRKLPRNDWSTHRIEGVMSPVTKDTIVDPHASMDTVLNRLEESPEAIAVGRPDHVVGIITRWDLATWLRRRHALAA